MAHNQDFSKITYFTDFDVTAGTMKLHMAEMGLGPVLSDSKPPFSVSALLAFWNT